MPGPPSKPGREQSDRWRELSWVAGPGQEMLKPARGVPAVLWVGVVLGDPRCSVGQLSWASRTVTKVSPTGADSGLCGPSPADS